MTAIDLFAGAGGFTTGATLAGVRVLWAANHWPAAVEVHKQNHPEVEHSCQDLHQADWSIVPHHDIILASPACQGHSKARGKDQPHHDATRSTAWAVVSCAEFHRSKYVIVENVPEFLRWKLYPVWKLAMEELGYKLTVNLLNAAEFGVPQSRKRVYIVCHRGKAITIKSPKLAEISARSIIDWNSGEWKPLKVYKGKAVVQQLNRARQLYGDRFLLAYYSSEKNGRSLDKPIGTITTNNHFLIVRRNEARMLMVDEARKAMGFPKGYILPTGSTAAMKMLGNACVPAVAAEILRQL